MSRIGWRFPFPGLFRGESPEVRGLDALNPLEGVVGEPSSTTMQTATRCAVSRIRGRTTFDIINRGSMLR